MKLFKKIFKIFWSIIFLSSMAFLAYINIDARDFIVPSDVILSLQFVVAGIAIILFISIIRFKLVTIFSTLIVVFRYVFKFMALYNEAVFYKTSVDGIKLTSKMTYYKFLTNSEKYIASFSGELIYVLLLVCLYYWLKRIITAPPKGRSIHYNSNVKDRYNSRGFINHFQDEEHKSYKNTSNKKWKNSNATYVGKNQHNKDVYKDYNSGKYVTVDSYSNDILDESYSSPNRAYNDDYNSYGSYSNYNDDSKSNYGYDGYNSYTDYLKDKLDY